MALPFMACNSAPLEALFWHQPKNKAIFTPQNRDPKQPSISKLCYNSSLRALFLLSMEAKITLPTIGTELFSTSF